MADRYAVIRQALSEPELNAKLFAQKTTELTVAY